MKVFHGEDGKAGYLVDVGVDGGSASFVVTVSFCNVERRYTIEVSEKRFAINIHSCAPYFAK